MEAVQEKTYSSPQRKLVKFFERSRNRWKAKSHAAKTVLKRLGTRLRRVEQQKADYQQQVGVLQRQVVEWQAKQEATQRELEALKKKYPQLSRESERRGTMGGRSCGIITIVSTMCGWWCR
jgi:peptidoglycan hydrolase CwlO-like protein